MNSQLVPPSDSLLSGMPSGREIHTPKPYVPPSLDEDTLTKMRAPPDDDDTRTLVADSDDSGGEAPQSRGRTSGSYPDSSGTGGGSYY